VGESVGISKLRCVHIKVIGFGGAELNLGWVDFDHSGDTDCTTSRGVIVTQSSGFAQTSGRRDDDGVTSAS
jgi:hypothetical protein